MLPGVQKKRERERREKNNCSRFPSMFLILIFFFLISYSSFVYSLVAPSEKKKKLKRQRLRIMARAIGGRKLCISLGGTRLEGGRTGLSRFSRHVFRRLI